MRYLICVVVLLLGILSVYRLATDDERWHIPLFSASLISLLYSFYIFFIK